MLGTLDVDSSKNHMKLFCVEFGISCLVMIVNLNIIAEKLYVHYNQPSSLQF